MEREKKIKAEVERTLNAYDNLENLDSNPFLYTRIKSRMEKSGQFKKAGYPLLTFVRAAAFSLLILLNGFTIYKLIDYSESQENFQSEYMEIIGNEYNLNQTAYYSYNIE